MLSRLLLAKALFRATAGAAFGVETVGVVVEGWGAEVVGGVVLTSAFALLMMESTTVEGAEVGAAVGAAAEAAVCVVGFLVGFRNPKIPFFAAGAVLAVEAVVVGFVVVVVAGLL